MELVGSAVNTGTLEARHVGQVGLGRFFCVGECSRLVECLLGISQVIALVNGSGRRAQVEVAQQLVVLTHSLGQGIHEVRSAQYIAVRARQRMVGGVVAALSHLDADDPVVGIDSVIARIDTAIDGIVGQIVGRYGGQFVFVRIGWVIVLVGSSVAPQQRVHQQRMRAGRG